ncbi:MAG: hypothetical protein ACXVBW_00820, partial [Bdellovibrionota bacterium]
RAFGGDRACRVSAQVKFLDPPVNEESGADRWYRKHPEVNEKIAHPAHNRDPPLFNILRLKASASKRYL